MGDKELYQQKMKAQLDLWEAEIDKADAKLKLNKQIKSLESEIKEGKVKLSALAEATDDAWHSIKEGVESAWSSLTTAVGDAVEKFKDK